MLLRKLCVNSQNLHSSPVSWRAVKHCPSWSSLPMNFRNLLIAHFCIKKTTKWSDFNFCRQSFEVVFLRPICQLYFGGFFWQNFDQILCFILASFPTNFLLLSWASNKPRNSVPQIKFASVGAFLGGWRSACGWGLWDPYQVKRRTSTCPLAALHRTNPLLPKVFFCERTLAF